MWCLMRYTAPRHCRKKCSDCFQYDINASLCSTTYISRISRKWSLMQYSVRHIMHFTLKYETEHITRLLPPSSDKSAIWWNEMAWHLIILKSEKWIHYTECHTFNSPLLCWSSHVIWNEHSFCNLSDVIVRNLSIAFTGGRRRPSE